MKFHKASSLKGTITVPGDKSISHRAVMLGSLAKGKTEIHNFLFGADCFSTIECFQKMGIKIDTVNSATDIIIIEGNGLHGLKAPSSFLDVGNSGTTLRLLSGILSAQKFDVEITGDGSIQRRPMQRIMDPLSLMGADITSVMDNNCAPLRIHGKQLKGIEYQSPFASAQVKSSILLAGLFADGKTSVIESSPSRNHSELMIDYFGGEIYLEGNKITVCPEPTLKGQRVMIPGDLSSAAYFIAAALIVPDSEIILRYVGTNPTRAGILEVVKQMGGNIELLNEGFDGEPFADILVRSSKLHGIEISGEIIPRLIDELPIIAVIAAFAEGQTVIKDATELKVKESDRIETVVDNLSSMGADITATSDGMIINGGRPLHGAVLGSRLDHRIAMSFAVAGLGASGTTEIIGSECVKISYPG
ncbi:MAG: 3-phosphoshikimate 1-carboxyvinyltransferase, partial [Clostridia bacterium]|nr:3-phosphoshikimate 1-carboxyvinyltransferase [Clostridia bacterium]